MRVRCIANTVSGLGDHTVRSRLQQSIHLDGPMAGLDIGGIYDVVAIHESDGGIWFLLDTIRESHHPYPYPAEMFEVIDPSLPVGWCIGLEKLQGGSIIKRIGFPEWVADDRFYERLIDGDKMAIAAYQRQRNTLRC